MRARRRDPDRRGRILEAALDVIAARGVAPLGSLTYHFTSLEDLRTQAFERHAERMSTLYAAHFDGVETDEQLVEALTDLIHGDAGAEGRDWVIAYELYLAALRDPELRVVTETWMRASRTVLERHVDADTARAVDALVEGLVLHRTLSTSSSTRGQIRVAVQRAVATPTRAERTTPRTQPA